ncbi:phage terminase large subunit [Lysinibacillus louembei]|uniref:Phage terminase large subunit n=1 Tax=Lysinibacillus louembei TaxID=1470088 RepID=A0ABZ0RXP0_9BACI|nr:phage terminase large subunit [Lysinibacillus louembei]WPK12250.1 phage terminase large subunit [Lysinibacillus louembei]
MTDEQLKELKKQAQLELARREFFYFCHLLAPKFYKENRKYLVELCNEMQDFYESDDEVLIINVPPRHGKSRSASMFAQWVFGQNQEEKIMTGSYNEMLSTTFSKAVRNGISEVKADADAVVYSDIFPSTTIKQGDAAMNLWSLEGGYNNYLATSPTGTATGFGASLLIIDDLIKNAEEAFNENTLDKHWEWFTNTMLSRLEEGGKIIIIMTRWSSKDLAGRALIHFKEEGKKVRHVNMKALQDDGTMLCDEVLSHKSYESKTRAMRPEIAAANYQQEPIDQKGRLYTSFKTYDGELPQFKQIKNYTDTADEGSDYLCTINYGVTFNDEAYVLDVLYTKDGMEVTEPATAKMLYEDKVNVADIESNGGGRGFARSVERLLKSNHNSNKTRINPFHQSKNKKARILSNATWVMDHIYFPSDWRYRWPEYYKAMTEYQKEGKNKHDDAPDATTGIAEKIGAGSLYSFE